MSSNSLQILGTGGNSGLNVFQYDKLSKSLGNNFANSFTGQSLGLGAENLSSSIAGVAGNSPNGTGGTFDFMGSENFANGVAGVAAIASLWNSFNSYTGMRAGIKNAQGQLDLMRQQYATENQRYNEREKERKAANEAIGESAKEFDLMPTQRI